jgi:hypothetical protein
MLAYADDVLVMVRDQMDVGISSLNSICMNLPAKAVIASWKLVPLNGTGILLLCVMSISHW